MIEFELPIPPTTNNLYVNRKGGRYRSQEYDAWLQHAGLMVPRPRPAAPVPCKVTVTIYGGTGFSKLRDIDNAIKPCLDLLVKTLVLAGDNVTRVQEATGRYVPGEGLARCVVRIEPAL